MRLEIATDCLTNTNGTMIDMCRKFHANNLACLRWCYDQLCQMLRIGQAVLIEIHALCQDLKGCIGQTNSFLKSLSKFQINKILTLLYALFLPWNFFALLNCCLLCLFCHIEINGIISTMAHKYKLSLELTLCLTGLVCQKCLPLL